jgi:NADH:ubiquinone oxidoreductase subunit 6 (subunit J)
MAARWAQKADVQVAPTTYGIGDAFLGPYILPFELASVVLLVVLVGAVVVSRKEIRGETSS